MDLVTMAMIVTFVTPIGMTGQKHEWFFWAPSFCPL
jgi:hypothetical protein